MVGANAAGLMSKIESFEQMSKQLQPSIFCIQESKLKRPHQIKTESAKQFTIYELHRKLSNGGGLCIGVHRDLRPVWVAQGDDEVECLVVEVWIEDFPVRILVGYGPQLSDTLDSKTKFWSFIEREADLAHKAGAGFILQMDSNCHLGKDFLENDVNDQNLNGKLFIQFLERMPNLTLINSLPLCEGSITRMRKTIKGVEKSILDVFVTCERILPYISKMKVDEKREHVLTNFSSVKKVGRVIESDHNPVILEVNLEFSPIKPERIHVFQFKNKESQKEFKKMTTETSEFTNCFNNNLPFEVQAKNWKKVLTKYFHKSFKKIMSNATSSIVSPLPLLLISVSPPMCPIGHWS